MSILNLQKKKAQERLKNERARIKEEMIKRYFLCSKKNTLME